MVVSADTLDAQVTRIGHELPSAIVQMRREFVTVEPRGFGLGLGLVFNLLIVM